MNEMNPSDDNPSFDKISKTKGRTTIFYVSAIVVACCVFAASLGVTLLRGEEENVANDSFQSVVAARNAAVPVKWLPDLRVLKGAPPTSLDLSAIVNQFRDEGKLGEPSPAPEDVELSLVSGGGDVADANLVGSLLTLAWKPDFVGSANVVVCAQSKIDPEQKAYLSFKAESWTPDYWAILLIVVGGGGLFLLGMRRMSEGLQAMAGAKLRQLISLFTTNRFMALGVGVFVTSIIQSSTACSVMTLGFVNSGMMTLSQAIGVLMGANIGTTATGWIFTINVGVLGLPLLGVSALFYLFCKKEGVRNFAMFAVGLGMIFFGLETLKNGLAPIADSPAFTAIFNVFCADTLKGALMCVLIGCFTTFLVHSSSVILAVTITLTMLGALNLNTAAAIVLGSNIGTSLTPLLVAIGAPATTRRAAYFHLVFNTIGVSWVMCVFFPVLIPCINAIGSTLHLDVPGRVALTHTLFNVANTILFLPFVTPLAALLERLVVDKGNAKKKDSKLSEFLEMEPSMAIERSRAAVKYMFNDCALMLEDLKTLKESAFEDERCVANIFKTEDRLDAIQDDTIDFVTRVVGRAQSSDVSQEGREQVRLAEELEELGDYFVAIVKSNLKIKREDNLEIPDRISDLLDLNCHHVSDSMQWLRHSYSERTSSDLAIEMERRREECVNTIKGFRASHIETMFTEKLDPKVIVAIDYQINAWRRIYGHLLNIAEAMDHGRRPAETQGTH